MSADNTTPPGQRSSAVPTVPENAPAHERIPASVPEFSGGETCLEAALMYAACGWYVLPVRQGAYKNPGSVVGQEWQRKSSRDPEQIKAWFAGTGHGIALHAGRSGAVVFDVDYPGNWPEEHRKLLLNNSAPFQSSNPADPERGHYVFADDERQFGSGLSKFPFGGWGEVRGGNAVIIAYPSVHEKHAEGRRYEWQSDGEPASLPPLLESWLSPPGASTPAYDGDAENFLSQFRGAHDDMSGAYRSLEWKAGEGEPATIGKCRELLNLAASGEPGVIAAWNEYLRNGTRDAAATRAMKRAIPGWQESQRARETSDWLASGYAAQLTTAANVTPDVTPATGFVPKGASDSALAKAVAARAQGLIVYGRDTGAYYALPPKGILYETYPVDLAVRSAADAMPTVDGYRAALGAQGTAESRAEIDADDDAVNVYKRARARMASAAGRGAVKQLLGGEMYDDGVTVAELDSEPHVLWAGGNAYDLTTGAPAAPGSYTPVNLKSCPVAPAPGPSPVFDLVTSAMWPDAEVRAYALRVIAGELLWGDTSKVHPVLDSPPNGLKSTFAEILLAVLGSYAVKVDPLKLIGGGNGAHDEEEKAKLLGARMVWLDEPPRRDKVSVSEFNALASGAGTVSAAPLRNGKRANVTMPSRFNFLVCQNPRNRLPLDAQGVAERIAFIPCNASTPATKAAYDTVQAGMAGEYPAILAKLIAECAAYHRGERLEVPHAVQMAIDAARDDGDEFTCWLLDNYDVLPPETSGADRALTVDTLRLEYNRVFPRRQLGRAEFRDRIEAVPVHVSALQHQGRRNLAAVRRKPVGQW